MHRKALIDSLAVWIEQNLENDIAYEDVVRRSGYSQWYLLWLFKKKTGHSLRDYILLRRLSLCATALVENTTSNIGDISERFCFSSPQYFCRAFKNRYGCSPSQYRRNNGHSASRATKSELILNRLE